MGTSGSYTAPTSGKWPTAKRVATRFARQGGAAGGSVTPRQVAQGYVAALGGAAAAGARANAGRASAGRLGGFLGDVAERGLREALEERGLAELIGRDAADVLAALVDELAGAGRTLEEAAARAAMVAVLADEFGEGEFEDLDAALQALDGSAVARLLELFLVEYVYRRMLEEIGDRIVNGSMTAAVAHRVELDIHDFLLAAVHLDLSQGDPLAINWEGAEGQELIDRLTADAYSQLE